MRAARIARWFLFSALLYLPNILRLPGRTERPCFDGMPGTQCLSEAESRVPEAQQMTTTPALASSSRIGEWDDARTQHFGSRVHHSGDQGGGARALSSSAWGESPAGQGRAENIKGRRETQKGGSATHPKNQKKIGPRPGRAVVNVPSKGEAASALKSRRVSGVTSGPHVTKLHRQVPVGEGVKDGCKEES